MIAYITASKFLTQIIHTQKNKNGVVLRPVIGKLKAAGAPIFFPTRALAGNAEYAACWGSTMAT